MRALPGPGKVKLWNGREAWVFTKYEHVRNILSDNRFSVDPSLETFPSVSHTRQIIANFQDRTFIRVDPPEHTRMRRMVTRDFMVKQVEAMKPHIAELVDEYLTEMIEKGSPGEIVEDLSLPLTSRVITDLLGVPFEDRRFFNEQTRLKVKVSGDPSVSVAARKATLAYLDNLFTLKEKNPADDIVTRMLHEQVKPGHLPREVAVQTCDMLMLAGHETTANQIALGILTLLSHPDQLAAVLRDRSLLPNAIEELLRYHTIVHYNGARVALEDVDINGVLIKKGEALFALISAANSDPSVFPNPRNFDILRDTTGHLTFSYGVHQCIGQGVARAELEAVFNVIFDRLPGLKLAIDPNEVEYVTDNIVLGVKALPVSWNQDRMIRQR